MRGCFFVASSHKKIIDQLKFKAVTDRFITFRRNVHMLEKMGDFFDTRLGDYDEHQLTCIDSAREFYPYTASLLPKKADSVILGNCATSLIRTAAA